MMPMLIIPTTIFASAACPAATYEFQMKNPIPLPLPDAEPPPVISSPATTTSQEMPIPTTAPTTIEGNTLGRTTRRKMLSFEAPIDVAALKYRRSILFVPPMTFRTIVKNAPRKITKPIDRPCVGQNRIDAGIQAIGG